MASIEILDRNIHFVGQVDTVQVDTVAIGVGTRHVERLDAAGAAEQVPGDAGVKPVFDQVFFASQKLEPLNRDNQMQVAGFFAYGTIATVDGNPLRNFYREPDQSTMTPA